jgi:hypothetical protein
MPIGLYMDQHVPRPITVGLRLRGIDVLTTVDDGTQRLADSLLLQRATELGRALFSQDADLLAEASRLQAESFPFAGVIYARQSSISIGRCIDDLHVLAAASNPEDLLNQVIYLPLR